MEEDKKKYETFEEMYLSTYRLVYIFIRDCTQDWDVAEEVSAIIWTKISERPEKYLDQEILQLHNYRRAMVKNEICEQYRKKDRENRILEKASEIFNISHTTEDDFLLKENLNALEKARAQLSEDERLLLELRFDQELSIKETGKVMGINQSAVKMRQCRVLLKLRKLID